jgi:hypothetical protein
VSVLFHSEVIAKIEEFQVRQLIVTRTEAIRRLIEAGLRHEQEAANAE